VRKSIQRRRKEEEEGEGGLKGNRVEPMATTNAVIWGGGFSDDMGSIKNEKATRVSLHFGTLEGY